MRPVDLTTNTHTLIAILAKKLILILLVIGTVSEVEDRFLAERFPLMLSRDFVLMVLEVTFFTEVGLLSQAVVSGHHVRAFLADHTLYGGNCT